MQQDKITDLPVLASAAADDVQEIVDVSTNTSKQVTIAGQAAGILSALDGAITNNKLSTTAGELGGAWGTWVPAYTNFTVGNGTLNWARFQKVGKTVRFRYKFTLGSTSAVGSAPTISLPVEAANAGMLILSNGLYVDSGGSSYPAWARNNTSDATTFRLGYWTSTNTAQNVASTAPMTFNVNDVIEIVGEYEAL